MSPPDYTDVLIVGAGPVGLVSALGLAQQDIDTVVIEKRELVAQEMFGRAVSLFARTLESLEQVGVADDIHQAGATLRNLIGYCEGVKTASRATTDFGDISLTSFHQGLLSIRQKVSQSIMARRYSEAFGREVHYQWQIVDYDVVDTGKADGYNVTATLEHPTLGKKTIRCKYLIGADGSASTVRELMDVAMVGEDTSLRWVRIDGLISTDIPDVDLGNVSIQNPQFPYAFIIKLDGGTYRIGYALTPAMLAKYHPNEPTRDQCVHEAQLGFRPHRIDIHRVDWHTIYSVKQRLAETMRKHDYVLLAGDAAHTHSSGLGQGMNTGIQDAINLAWKLAGQIRGWYTPAVLDTYSPERRAIAQRVIDIDREAADCMSGILPPQFRNSGLSSLQVVQKLMQANAKFSVGLAVGYEHVPSVLGRTHTAGNLFAGIRAPDCLVKLPGPPVSVRLHTLLHQSRGRWNILVFAGYPHQTVQRFKALRQRFDDAAAAGTGFASKRHVFNLFTLIVGGVVCVWDAFEGPALGKCIFDQDMHAHWRFGVPFNTGLIAVVRPDGYVGFAAPLDHFDAVDDYFSAILA